MLIDGEEVIYSMEDNKVVYPEIPTEGLVCYLDTRGKYNTDVYRNTLLDLSGNGNHGTLRNFSFADGSGYENGGLKFDGVDDNFIYSHDIKETDPRTIFIDFKLEQSAKEQNVNAYLPFGLRVNKYDDYIAIHNRTPYFNTGVNKMTKGTHKFVITIESTIETGKMYYLGNVYDNTPLADVGTYHSDPKSVYSYGKKILNRAMLYDRVLTDEEITKLMEVE